jgi:hypothetical protein
MCLERVYSEPMTERPKYGYAVKVLYTAGRGRAYGAISSHRHVYAEGADCVAQGSAMSDTDGHYYGPAFHLFDNVEDAQAYREYWRGLGYPDDVVVKVCIVDMAKDHNHGEQNVYGQPRHVILATKVIFEEVVE